MPNSPLWCMRAGSSDQAYDVFINKQYLAYGGSTLGDLSQVPKSREALKSLYAAKYPETVLGAIPVQAGQLYRYLFEMKIGDLILYPSKRDREVHYGRVEGDYTYNSTLNHDYPHLRKVKWLKSIPRTQFTQAALYEIGSALTLFQVKYNATEFLNAFEGKVIVPEPEIDKTVAIVATEIEETTRDFILKVLAQELKGHPLSHFVAHLLGTMGYRTRVSSPGPDGGIDIIAHRDELGFEPPIIKVQVKSMQGSIGLQDVSGLYGNVDQNEYGLFVTLGSFTNQARTFAQGKSNLRLIDANSLVDLILEHYDQFDPRYKGILPLKRVFIPAALQGEE